VLFSKACFQQFVVFVWKKQIHSGQVLCELGGERQDSRLNFQIAELSMIL